MQLEDRSTHIVLDVQVTASFQQDAHHLQVAFVGGQVQGASAVLSTQNTQRNAINKTAENWNTNYKKSASTSEKNLQEVKTVRPRGRSTRIMTENKQIPNPREQRAICTAIHVRDKTSCVHPVPTRSRKQQEGAAPRQTTQ